jgi:uncharacterized protein
MSTGRTPSFSFGRFVWHEIVTPDLRRSRAFYAELLGWKFQDLDMGGQAYPMMLAGGVPQGGLQVLGRLPGTAPHVLGFLSVPDVDAAVAAARGEGGRTLAAPVDLGGVGRLAVLADATGAPFSVLHSRAGDGPEIDDPAPGMFCWDQLASADLARARRFYNRVLGWTDRALSSTGAQLFVRPHGPAGPAGGKPAAGLVQADAGAGSHWLSHVVVDDLRGARARAARLGGKVLVDEVALPGRGTAAVIADNVGVRLGLLQPAT